MKILMHACCGPCSIVPAEELLNEGASLFAHFENPNIHPFTEWEKRRETFMGHMDRMGVRVLPDKGYGLKSWMREVSFREAQRCAICYRMRLSATAALARSGGFDAFTTTLLYSKFQNHEKIRETGEAAAAEYGVPFLYRDFRTGWKRGVEESKRLGMYRQQYCGCALSEEERYAPKKGERLP